MKKKFLTLLAAFMAFLFALSGPAAAVRQDQVPLLPSEAELMVLNRQQDVVIAVRFDVETPDIAVISPSGQIYAEDYEFARVERTDTVLYLYLLDAESGRWTVKYDKKRNTVCDVVVTPWDHPLHIDSLTIHGMENDGLRASAEVSCDRWVNYQYYAYAVTLAPDGSVDGKVELEHGWGSSDSMLELWLPLDDLPDGTYSLQLEVYYTNDSGAELPAFRLSGTTFTVTGNTLVGDPSQFITELDLTRDTLRLDWSGAEGYYTDWTLALYTGGSTEPVYSNSFEENVRQDEVILDPGEGDVRVTLMGALSGGGYVSFARTIQWNTGVEIAFETPEVTNALRGAIRFDTAGQTLRAELKINDDVEQLQLSGSDTLSFRLEEMEVNEISLRYRLEEGSYYLVSQRISVDSVPPTLTLYGLPAEVTTTERTIIVSGGTEAGATLTVNGEVRETDETGEFVTEIALNEGSNVLVFEASDMAGNKTSRTLIANYSPSGTVIHMNDERGGFPWILVVTILCSLLALLFMWIFAAFTGRRIKKDGGRGETPRKILAMLEGLLCSVFLSGVVLSVVFLMMAIKQANLVTGANLVTTLEQYGTQEVASILARKTSLQNWSLAALITAIVAAGLVVLLLFLGKNLRKAKPPKEKPAKPKPAKEKPVPEKKTEKKVETKPGTCPHCGARLEPGARFCGVCGKPVG